MEETPQREVTAFEQRARRRTRAERDMRIRERAWVLYRERAKGVDTKALSRLSMECMVQTIEFEETMDAVLGHLEENGEPFAPAPQPSERDRGIVGKDARRVDLDALADALARLVDEADAFLEGGHRND